ncbi:MAG: hypothetical protein HXX10_08670 [Rhodoplanes sp.]|uniref:hypothetical protein n=1 Tax=Rhodoplanes sp. TaxID=1968906 RepID=UPI00185476F4|nr:hypothetical protein [Rhodoplanes sp.]NVO14095.1 hypothetical protein [Rhodoplanes sp.]
MRGLVLAAALAAGVGVFGAAPVSAAPLNGAGLVTSDVAGVVTQVQWHGPNRSHWRWGSRGGAWHDPGRSHWRFGSRPRCHWRGSSAWGRC